MITLNSRIESRLKTFCHSDQPPLPASEEGNSFFFFFFLEEGNSEYQMVRVDGNDAS